MAGGHNIPESLGSQFAAGGRYSCVWPKATRYNAEGYVGGATYVAAMTRRKKKREVRRSTTRRRSPTSLFFGRRGGYDIMVTLVNIFLSIIVSYCVKMQLIYNQKLYKFYGTGAAD